MTTKNTHKTFAYKIVLIITWIERYSWCYHTKQFPNHLQFMQPNLFPTELFTVACVTVQREKRGQKQILDTNVMQLKTIETDFWYNQTNDMPMVNRCWTTKHSIAWSHIILDHTFPVVGRRAMMHFEREREKKDTRIISTIYSMEYSICIGAE